jgi:hypothetical protein
MPPFNAMAALVAAGTDRRAFPALDGVPKVMLTQWTSTDELIRDTKALALVDPDGARATLAAWLSGPPVDGDLDLRFCHWLQTLPAGVQVGRHLYLDDCRGLRSLPDGLHVAGNFDLVGCPALKSIGQGLTVGGKWLLDHCAALRTLPSGVQVGGPFALFSRMGPKGMPRDLVIEGDLVIPEKSPLSALPDTEIRALVARIGGQILRW